MNTCELEAKCDIIDAATPKYNPLSGRYKKSFAFNVLCDRYPVILTAILEQLKRDKTEIAELYSGEETLKDINLLTNSILKLKRKLKTDQKLEKLHDRAPDRQLWNNFISHLPLDLCSFFHTNSLYAECYLYRKLFSFFERTKTLKNYDYFSKPKQNSLKSDGVFNMLNGVRNSKKDFKTFEKFLKLNLWANKCDLNIILPREFNPEENLFEQINSFNDKLLINNSKQIWQCLATADHSKPVIVEFVNDNAGYELLTDLILADYLIDKELASKVRFSVKAIPWFVSDVIPSDISWLLDYLTNLKTPLVNTVVTKLKQYFKEKQFIISPVHYFWVSPYEYYKMREHAPDLYQYLSEAQLVIFKGDLNYRKLLGEIYWDPTDEFITCIRGFRPTNFCALRSIKSEIVCGLSQGKAEQLHSFDKNWMCLADYGVIQFMAERLCNCHKILNT